MTELELLKLIKFRLCKIYQEDKHSLNLNLVASLDLDFQLNYTAVLGLCNLLSFYEPLPNIEGIDDLEDFGTMFECWHSRQYQDLIKFFQNLPDENICKFFNIDSLGEEYFANPRAVDLAHLLSRYAPEIKVDLSEEKLNTPATSLCKSAPCSFDYFPNCRLLRHSILKHNIATDYSNLSAQDLSDFYNIDSEQHKEIFVLDLPKEPYCPLGVVSYFQPLISPEIGKINRHLIDLLTLCLLHNGTDLVIKEHFVNCEYVDDLNNPKYLDLVTEFYNKGNKAALRFEQAYDNYQKVGDEASLQELIAAQKAVNSVIDSLEELPYYSPASFDKDLLEDWDNSLRKLYINQRANSFFNHKQSFNPTPINLYLRDIAHYLLQELPKRHFNFDSLLDQLQRIVNTMPARVFYDLAVLTYDYDNLASHKQTPTKLLNSIVSAYKKRNFSFSPDSVSVPWHVEDEDQFKWCIDFFKIFITVLNEQMLSTLVYDYQAQDKGLKDHQMPMAFTDEDIALIFERYQENYHAKLADLVAISERLSALNTDAASDESQADNMYYYGFKWLSRALNVTLELLDEHLNHNNMLSRDSNIYHVLCRGVIEVVAAMIEHYENVDDTLYLNIANSIQEAIDDNLSSLFEEINLWLHPLEKWQDQEFFAQHISKLHHKLPNLYFMSEEHLDILCYQNYYQLNENKDLLYYAPIANPMLLEILISYKEILCLDVISLFQQMLNNLAVVTYSQKELKTKLKDLHSSFYFKANPTIKIFTFIGLKYQEYFNSLEEQLNKCVSKYSKLIEPIFASNEYLALCSSFDNLLDAYEQSLNKVNQECLPTILPTDLLEEKFKNLKLLRFMLLVLSDDPYALFDYDLLTSNEQHKQFLEKHLGIFNKDDFAFHLDSYSNLRVYQHANFNYLHYASELLFGPQITANMFVEPDPKSKVTKDLLIGRVLNEFVENSKRNMNVKKSKTKSRNKKRR